MLQHYTTTRHVTVERHDGPLKAKPVQPNDWTGNAAELIRETEKLLAKRKPGRPRLDSLPRQDTLRRDRVELPRGGFEFVNDDGISPGVLVDGMLPRDLAQMFLRIAAAYPGAKSTS